MIRMVRWRHDIVRGVLSASCTTISSSSGRGGGVGIQGRHAATAVGSVARLRAMQFGRARPRRISCSWRMGKDIGLRGKRMASHSKCRGIIIIIFIFILVIFA